MNRISLTFILTFLLTFSIRSQPINDNPCSAIVLPVMSDCSFAQFTNLDATDSGVDAPPCSSYSGGDVWFKSVIPYSGAVTISIYSEATQQFPDNDGWIYRPGLAIYTGTCNSLIHDTCWIDVLPESPPRKPMILLENLQPGDTLWLRLWEYANNDNGVFQICVFDHSGDIPYDLVIPEGFSPNGDGSNETFEIQGINYYPENEISIYNIWGYEVFKMKQYDNSWTGISGQGVNKGKELPTASYFYILRLSNSKIIKGSVYLKRE